VQATHDGADGDVLAIGDFLVAQSRFCEQNERAANIGVKAIDGGVNEAGEVFAFELEALFRRRGGIDSVVLVVARWVEGDALAPLALAAEVERGVGDNPEQPGAEFTAAIKIGQVTHGFHKTILHGIFGILMAAQETESNTIGDIEMATEEFFPGGERTTPREVDEHVVRRLGDSGNEIRHLAGQ
jgi:hypothetical protein